MFAKQLPALQLSKEDVEGLYQLEATLVVNNMEQYSQMLHCSAKSSAPGKLLSSGRWRQMRKVQDLRIYEERTPNDSVPAIPSILMLGTVVGDLDDVMYACVAATDAEETVLERVLQDGAEESKVLQCLVSPTEREPFRHVSVKWRLYSTRDYVSLDATGFTRASSGERVGYVISHSIDFGGKLPSFHRDCIDRGNRSVCVLYRQKTPNAVECYARGFFDFETGSDPVANAMALQVIATQWVSFARITELAEMKKLVWQLKQQVPCCAPILSECKPDLTACASCRICNKHFGILGGAKACGICLRAICSRCCVKKLVCVMEEDGSSVREEKRPFCAQCLQKVSFSDAVSVAREEIRRDSCCGRDAWERDD